MKFDLQQVNLVGITYQNSDKAITPGKEKMEARSHQEIHSDLNAIDAKMSAIATLSGISIAFISSSIILGGDDVKLATEFLSAFILLSLAFSFFQSVSIVLVFRRKVNEDLIERRRRCLHQSGFAVKWSLLALPFVILVEKWEWSALLEHLYK